MLCALAWSAGSLIAFRVIQGFGGDLLTPVGTTIIARAAGPQRMGRVMSLMGVPLLLGPIVGPVLGGALLQVASWHWIFLINVPIGLLALVLGRCLLPRAERLDFVGLLLMSSGLAALIFGVSQVRALGALTSPAVLVSVAVAVVLSLFLAEESCQIGAAPPFTRVFRDVGDFVTGRALRAGRLVLRWFPRWWRHARRFRQPEPVWRFPSSWPR